MSFEPGALFDRYRIEALLGEGGMGRVYRAYDERLQRRIALKILDASAGGAGGSGPATDGSSKLLREARAAAALDHANAVAIHDVGEARTSDDAPPVPFIAMELVLGRNLRAYVGAADVSRTDRIRWLADVARALAAAHERGLVHRDIKPENVMIRQDGAVKVLDFGIARRTGRAFADPSAPTQAQGVITLTAEGVVVGTPFYMAPEQMRGEAVDGRADQFSWGVVAYELLSGKLPWDREGDALVIVSQVLSAEPPPLHDLVPGISPELEAIVSRAMAKAAADRFPSMAAIVEHLDALGGFSGSRAPPRIDSETLGHAPTVRSTRTSLAAAAGRPLAPRRVASRLAMGGGLALASVVLAVGLRGRGNHAPPVPAAAPTAVTDLPLPKTSPEALTAYVAGLRALREGHFDEMHKQLERAVAIDDHLGPALMRLALGKAIDRPEEARAHYNRALQVRGSMTERDQSMLDAFEPYVARDPSDQAETRARLAALAARYPLDAEIAFDLGVMDAGLSEWDRAVAELRRASEIDPQFVLPLFTETYLVGMVKGNFDAARDLAERCERLAPAEPRCLVVRNDIDVQEGRCEELAADARQMIVRTPNAWNGYFYSAQALFQLGSPMPAVREAVAQARARMGEMERGWPEMAQLDLDLDVLDGNFLHADELERARVAEPALAARAEETAHGLEAWTRVQLASEMGRPTDAVAIAADFQARMAAWTPPPAISVQTLDYDRKLRLLAVLHHAGRLSGDRLEAARRAWLARWGDKPPAGTMPYLWVEAYASLVETADEARAALDALPRYGPFPAFWQVPSDLAIGKTYLLAGDVDSAMPFLRRGATSCNALRVPFEHVQASLYLGDALAAKGDKTGACAAYGTVVDRWGSAKPASTTATAARARAKAAGCAL